MFFAARSCLRDHPHKISPQKFMTLRKGHGAGAGQPRIEVLPPDEQPHVAAVTDPLSTDRDAAGRVTTTAAAKALARLPRRSKALPRKLALDPVSSPTTVAAWSGSVSAWPSWPPRM